MTMTHEAGYLFEAPVASVAPPPVRANGLNELYSREREGNWAEAPPASLRWRVGSPPAAGLPRVVFIPGIMGSGLVDPTAIPQRLWGNITAWVSWNPPPLTPLPSRMPEWFGRITDGNGVDLPGRVSQAGDVMSLPGLVDPYAPFLRILGGATDLLVFTYDWRLSNTISARALAEAIRLRWWPEGQPAEVSPEQRVTIITHSMGGLVARFYIEALGGRSFTQRLITGGTPHLGGPEAYSAFHGKSTPLPWFGIPPPMQQDLVRAYASTLQLLPVEPFAFSTRSGTTIWETPATVSYRGMVHSKTGRTAVDLWELLRPPAGATRPGLKDPRTLDAWLAGPGLEYHFLAGDGLPTITFFDRDHNVPVVRPVGDKTVPLMSALLKPPWFSPVNIKQVLFPGVEHQKIFNTKAVRNYILGQLHLPLLPELEPELVQEGVLV